MLVLNPQPPKSRTYSSLEQQTEVTEVINHAQQCESTAAIGRDGAPSRTTTILKAEAIKACHSIVRLPRCSLMLTL